MTRGIFGRRASGLSGILATSGASGAITFFCVGSMNTMGVEGDNSCISGVVSLTKKGCIPRSAKMGSGTLSAVGVRVRRFCTGTGSTSCVVCGDAVSKRLGAVSRLLSGDGLLTSFGTIGGKGI